MLDVEVEFNSLFRGQPLFADVDTHVREHGWRLLGLRRVAWRRPAGVASGGSGYGGQLVSADALYFNARALREGLDLKQMLKLALIFSAYRQHDFARALLQREPVRRLPSAERAALDAFLSPVPSAPRRLAASALRRVGRGTPTGSVGCPA